ncbi:MAG: ribosome silencing factor [Treponemataceae bacterium]|nr:ribosome silencing factor [Treponemataceae bacterium]
MQERSLEQKAADIAAILEEGKGRDVVVLDVSQLNSWTDYFVIATVTSSAHWQGLYRQVQEYAQDAGLEIHKTNRRSPSGDDWNLIDLGPIVVHLMSESARSFYDLEKLWHSGRLLERCNSAEQK